MEVNNNYNPAWKNHGYYTSFDEADSVRNEILKDEKMQAKVRRRDSSGRFLVKTRVHPDHQEVVQKKGGKKSGKSKRRNKKNSERGVTDTPTTV